MARRAQSTKTAICAYCGLRAKATREHVPPRSLWPRPRPADLITVDACYDCNNKGKLDDEYLRLTLIMIADTAAGTKAGEVMTSTLEALRSDPKKRRFRDMIYGRVTVAPVRTASGLFIPRAPIFTGDRPRLDGIFKRVARGLTQYEGLPRLPPGTGVRVLLPGDWSQLPPEVEQLVVATLQTFLGTEPRRAFDGVFRYWYLRHAKRPTVMLWLLRFYDSVDVVVSTTDFLNRDAVEAEHGTE